MRFLLRLGERALLASPTAMKFGCERYFWHSAAHRGAIADGCYTLPAVSTAGVTSTETLLIAPLRANVSCKRSPIWVRLILLRS